MASLSLSRLLLSFPSSIAQGLIWGIVALGIYITFRMLSISDLSVDGTITTGGAVVTVLIVSGWNPWIALIVAFLAGMLAGLVTGILHTKFGIPAILAGILTQFSLYSINLWIMDFRSNIALRVDSYPLILSSRYTTHAIIIGLLIVAILVAVMYWYFGTESGSAMRATGNNPEMAKALGININTMKMLGLALSNGIVAFAGGVLAQFQGFADINMGRGAIVIGLAAIIIGEVLGEALFKHKLNFAGRFSFVALGGVVYYMVITVVLWLRLNTNMLRLFTSIIVAIFLAIPYLQNQANSSFARAHQNSLKEDE